ncbi:MAG TPA: MSMEG_4193 family putative phosphomutase [Anaerolineae bacterium]|nr:MSMEG_4193 family putative phosphomutase [Anaerolineae bacterium]
MMAMMNLLLIRHAVNDWVGERLAGWTPGVHLNNEGRAQAAALAQRLETVPLAAVYSSPLERTLETAHPLAQAHGLAVQVREGLGEAQYGDWTGRALKELKDEALWPVIQVYPGGVRFPGGESMRETQARIVAELDAIRDAHPGQTVAVVSHSDPIKMAVAHYTGLALDLFQRIAISPASVTAFAFAQYGPRLICLNVTDPLPSFKIEKEESKEQ